MVTPAPNPDALAAALLRISDLAGQVADLTARLDALASRARRRSRRLPAVPDTKVLAAGRPGPRRRDHPAPRLGR